MARDKKSEKIKSLLERMQKDRGYVLPPWEFAVNEDVDFMEAYNNLYTKALTDGKALPAKTRELIVIALLAYRGLENEVYTHAKRALRLGATRQELLEAIETVVIPGGAPALASGLRALMRIEQDQKG